MRECPNCGFRTENEARFCVNCSTALPEIAVGSVALPLKNLKTVTLIAGLLGVVFMGVGHFYIYRITRGLVLLLLGTVTGLIFVVAALGGFFAASVEIAAIVGLARLVLWVWQTRDAYVLAKAYNNSLKYDTLTA